MSRLLDRPTTAIAAVWLGVQRRSSRPISRLTSAPVKTRRGGDDSKQDGLLVEITERNMTSVGADQIRLAPTEHRH